MARITGIFPITGTEEVFGVYEWKPKPEQIAARLMELADDIEDMTVPMLASRQVFIDSTERHFDEEKDPRGKEWAPLSKSYEKDKRKRESAHPDEILQLTGDLKSKATSEEAWLITGNEIIFNPSILPPYAAVHQSGSETYNYYATITMETASREDIKSGPGTNTPPRQYIGLNEFDILAVEEIFARWFNRQVDAFVEDIGDMGLGGGQFGLGFGSNAGGTFPIKGFTSSGQPILHTPKGPRFGRRI